MFQKNLWFLMLGCMRPKTLFSLFFLICWLLYKESICLKLCKTKSINPNKTITFDFYNFFYLESLGLDKAQYMHFSCILKWKCKKWPKLTSEAKDVKSNFTRNHWLWRFFPGTVQVKEWICPLTNWLAL